MQPTITSGVSSASVICRSASSPITLWWIRTWFRTEPSAYLVVPPLVAAASTASEIAMPRLPGESGSSASAARPAAVCELGLGITLAPKSSMRARRAVF